MNENTKIALSVIIAVLLSVSLSYMLITPQEGVMGPPGEGVQGIQGEQGPQGPPGESMIGPTGEGFSLAGTWVCILNVENHPVADILEVVIDSDVFIVQWEYRHDADRFDQCFIIMVCTLYNVQFEESSSAQYGSGTMLLAGAGEYRVGTFGAPMDGLHISIRVYQLV